MTSKRDKLRAKLVTKLSKLENEAWHRGNYEASHSTIEGCSFTYTSRDCVKSVMFLVDEFLSVSDVKESK